MVAVKMAHFLTGQRLLVKWQEIEISWPSLPNHWGEWGSNPLYRFTVEGEKRIYLSLVFRQIRALQSVFEEISGCWDMAGDLYNSVLTGSTLMLYYKLSLAPWEGINLEVQGSQD